jgi:hypothetical protein
MNADIFERLRQATVAIVNADAGVQALTGRATENCVAWDRVAEAVRPVIAYHIVLLGQQGESGDGRDGTVQFTAIADGNDADALTNELLHAVELAYTAPALLAQGVDGAPMLLDRRAGDSDTDGEDGPRDLTRNTQASHLDVAITLTNS